MRINLGEDTLVELLGPVNMATSAPITAGTCYARLFDDRRDTALTANVSSGLVLNVADASKWAVGYQALVWLDNATWHDGGAVTAVDTAAKTISITNAVPSLARAGATVARALGDGTANSYRITLAFFQTAAPVRGAYDFGFRGTIPDTHPRLQSGMIVRAEFDLDAGVGVRLVSNMRAIVLGGS